MAKGQKRGNREIKKPKSSKAATAPTVPILVSKGVQSLVSPKKA
jgi:hypothetical protein